MKKLMLLFDAAKVQRKTGSIKSLQRIGHLFQRMNSLRHLLGLYLLFMGI
jgi:hypothetical protein